MITSRRLARLALLGTMLGVSIPTLQASATHDLQVIASDSGTGSFWAAFALTSDGSEFRLSRTLPSHRGKQVFGTMVFDDSGAFKNSYVAYNNVHRTSYRYNVAGVPGGSGSHEGTAHPAPHSPASMWKLDGEPTHPRLWYYVVFGVGDNTSGWTYSIEAPPGVRIARDEDGEPLVTRGSGFLFSHEDFPNGSANVDLRQGFDPVGDIAPQGFGVRAHAAAGGALSVDIGRNFVGGLFQNGYPLGATANRIFVEHPSGAVQDCTQGGCGALAPGDWGAGRYRWTLEASVGAGQTGFGEFYLWGIDMAFPTVS